MRSVSFALVAFALAAAGTGATASSGQPMFCSSRIDGDFDGDGRGDTASVYSTRSLCDEAAGRHWFLLVTLDRGGKLRRPLRKDRPAFSEGGHGCEFRCMVSAATDLNRDGRDELEVSLQQGASQEQRGFYGVVGERLRRFGAGGQRQPLSFSYGGSVMHGAYVVCRAERGRHFVVGVEWGVTSTKSPGQVGFEEHVYRFEGRTFRHVRTGSGRSRGVVPPRVSGRSC